MPTKRPRLTVTETPDVARRLDSAAAHFPALAGSRRDLLLRLTELGEQALAEQSTRAERRAAARRRVIEQTQAMTADEAVEMLAERDAAWRRDEL
jgi:crotonobetainyl-CoA:carnitine CoA-transferase CaiB-like acyl-CoA transferase